MTFHIISVLNIFSQLYPYRIGAHNFLIGAHMPTEAEQGFGKQFEPWSRKIGGLFSGPGRQLYDIPTHAPIQEAAKYPLLFGALQNLMGGRNTNAFNPIEERARNQFNTQTVPSIAQRFASVGDTAGSSGFAGELAGAGRELERDLSAERAKFGQEEERIRQSGLEQLLKFGLQPTSEKVLMQRPEGEIPPTFEKAFGETYGPHIAEKYGEFKNWADRALENIEGKSPEERNLAERAALKGGRALQPVGRAIEKGVKAALTPTAKGTAAGEAATKEFEESPAAQAYPGRVKGSKAERFKDAQQQAEINNIMDRAGVQNASDLRIFSNANKSRKGKKPLSYGGLQKFNELALNPAFSSNAPEMKNALKLVANEQDIERMLLYFTQETPNRKLIPKTLRNEDPYWKQVYNKTLPTPRRGK